MSNKVYYSTIVRTPEGSDPDCLVFWGATPEAARHELAEWCRSEWVDRFELDDEIPDEPDDDEALIDLFFDDYEYAHQDEIECSANVYNDDASSSQGSATSGSKAEVHYIFVRYDGSDIVFLDGTSDGVINQLADWCRENWNGDDDAPDDNIACVDQYFNATEDEYIALDSSEVVYNLNTRAQHGSSPVESSADSVSALQGMLNAFKAAIGKDSPLSDMAKQIVMQYFHSLPSRAGAILGQEVNG